MSVLPIMHAPSRPLRGLVIGQHAAPLGAALLRYPDTALVSYLQATPPNHGKARQLPSISLLDGAVDVAAVAVEGSPLEMAHLVRQRLTVDGAAVIAVSNFKSAHSVLAGLKGIFPYVAPMRVYMPDRCVLFLVGCAPVKKTRPCPDWTRSLSDQFIPSMFTFSKDEYRAIFQGIQ